MKLLTASVSSHSKICLPLVKASTFHQKTYCEESSVFSQLKIKLCIVRIVQLRRDFLLLHSDSTI